MQVAKADYGFPEAPASGTELREVLARCEPLTERGPGASATVLAILAALPTAAFIVDGAARVLVANARGHRELREEPQEPSEWLARELANASVEIHALPAGADGGERHLVLRGDPLSVFGARIARAAELWRLTPHQVNVLQLLVHGEANKTIAIARRCSLRTVEVHVSGLLKKSETSSRAELIARFWTLR